MYCTGPERQPKSPTTGECGGPSIAPQQVTAYGANRQGICACPQIHWVAKLALLLLLLVLLTLCC